MTRVRRGRLAPALAVALALVVGTGACADTKAKERAAATSKVGAVPAGVVPSELLGLTVTPETVQGDEASKKSYVDAVSLYGLREGDELKATLQLSRFNEAAKPETAKFRGSILNRIGGTRPKKFRMGDVDVYFTTATKQTLAVWFRGDHLFVLAAREDYDRPRSLVRAALEVKP
jgi:hypothetical protein